MTTYGAYIAFLPQNVVRFSNVKLTHEALPHAAEPFVVMGWDRCLYLPDLPRKETTLEPLTIFGIMPQKVPHSFIN